MSSVLGSMAPDTSCDVEITWTSHGSPDYKKRIRLTDDECKQIDCDLSEGRANLSKHNEAVDRIKSSDQSIQKHLYFNQRQYAGRQSS